MRRCWSGIRASVEAVLDRARPFQASDRHSGPSDRGRIVSAPEAGEIQRAIREGFRDALREAQLERLALASNPQPKRRGWFASVLGFFLCVGLGSAATFALTAYHPRPSAVAGLEDLGSPVATPGSQSNPVPPPSRARPAPIACLRRRGPRASPVLGSLACINNKRARWTMWGERAQ